MTFRHCQGARRRAPPRGPVGVGAGYSDAVNAPSAPLDSGERSASYRRVERLHLRQWVLRCVLPVAVLCTNGAGALAVDWWPRHDAWLGGEPAELAVRGAGAFLIVTAAWLRVLSKGVLVRKRRLTTGGAYAHVRHPFYLATLIGAVGLLALSGTTGALLALPWLVLAAPVFAITIAGEEDGLSTLYPERWDAYRAAVPALLPLPRHAAPPPDPVRVTWANLVAEREPPRLLRFLGGAALVAAAGAAGAAGTALGAVAVALFGSSYALPALLGSRRRDEVPRAE